MKLKKKAFFLDLITLFIACLIFFVVMINQNHTESLNQKNFSDFSSIKTKNAYYAYGTSSNHNYIPLKKSIDGKKYYYVHDALPEGVPWAASGGLWAPNVFKVDAEYIMYFSGINKETKKRAIGVAIANNPEGPFTALPEFMASNDNLGGLIGPQHFYDGNNLYILYKNDGNSLGIKSTLWLHQLTKDGRNTVGQAIALLDNYQVTNPNDQSKHPSTIEGPVMIQAPDGKYVLFFAGNNYATANYFTGYAVSDNVTGPFDYMGPLITTTSSMESGERVIGPGIGDAIPISQNKYYLTFNGWVNGIGSSNGGHRDLFYRYLSWKDGHTPYLYD